MGFLADVLGRLATAGIDYCVVGGVAVNLHGVPRMTFDVDVVVRPTADMLSRLEAELVGLGLRCRLPVRLIDFADPAYREEMRSERSLIAVTFTDPRDPLREVDVLVAPPVPAEQLLAGAVELDLGGSLVRVVSVPDLIAMKLATGRKQDGDDVAALQRILGAADE